MHNGQIITRRECLANGNEVDAVPRISALKIVQPGAQQVGFARARGADGDDDGLEEGSDSDGATASLCCGFRPLSGVAVDSEAQVTELSTRVGAREGGWAAHAL